VISASQNVDGASPDFRPAQRAMGHARLGVEADFDWSWQSKTFGSSVPGVSVSITTTFLVRDRARRPASRRSMAALSTRLGLTE